MGKIPSALRETIARNIRACRLEKFPGRGGGKKCADSFGVTQQQWSPWERGMRTPDEYRLEQIAAFFGKTVAWMRCDHRAERMAREQGAPAPESAAMPPPCAAGPEPPGVKARAAGIVGIDTPPPSWEPAQPGSPESFFWLARHFLVMVQTHGLRLDKQSIDYLADALRYPRQ